MKKTWRKPQLLILTRSKPEEDVLIGCKGMPIPTGSDTAATGCTLSGTCPEPCSDPSNS